MQRRRAFVGSVLAGAGGLVALGDRRPDGVTPSDRLVHHFDTLLNPREEFFGDAVSLSSQGGTALVGKRAVRDPDAVHHYVRERGFWTRDNTLPGILGPDERDTPNFGNSLDQNRDGSLAIFGAPGEDQRGHAVVYSLSRNYSRQQAVLRPDDADQEGWVGEEVALSADGQYALVSALFKNGQLDLEGAVYVYHRDGGDWAQQAKLGPVPNTRFGTALDIDASGTTALVGAKYADLDTAEDSDPPVAGAAYLFRRDGSTWELQRHITPDHPWYLFGYSVGLDDAGSTAIVGARRPQGGAYNGDSGAAHIFASDATGWSEQTRIVFEDNYDRARFGAAVAISGDGQTALVGDPFHSSGERFKNGSALLYRREGSSWTQAMELTGASMNYDDFGRAVALGQKGQRALVGSPYRSEDGSLEDRRSGSAYLFDVSR